MARGMYQYVFNILHMNEWTLHGYSTLSTNTIYGKEICFAHVQALAHLLSRVRLPDTINSYVTGSPLCCTITLGISKE